VGSRGGGINQGGLSLEKALAVLKNKIIKKIIFNIS
jgi:hypothetical protein